MYTHIVKGNFTKESPLAYCIYENNEIYSLSNLVLEDTGLTTATYLPAECFDEIYKLPAVPYFRPALIDEKERTSYVTLPWTPYTLLEPYSVKKLLTNSESVAICLKVIQKNGNYGLSTSMLASIDESTCIYILFKGSEPVSFVALEEQILNTAYVTWLYALS